ncbi:hypothetical protein PIB30_071621 [Stylosanthes scabra]|uniref:Uncharacterized protein n=1 Tax=Stylosanthes scabra TaxID=79078 RepID=A0ABU6YM08_9FABA|nr:hypothetical protein [Stylosanthes scabra]
MATAALEATSSSTREEKALGKAKRKGARDNGWDSSELVDDKQGLGRDDAAATATLQWVNVGASLTADGVLGWCESENERD